ncbi:MAG: hypothetical protein HPY65_17955 [Syntrophaceae bacterium]|nr:hypothetical protein [Syntrophaceae bacterium]
MQSRRSEPRKNLAEYDGEDRIVSSRELWVHLSREKEALYVNAMSGIPGIDRACQGFQDGELVVISGPTKNGKTLLAQTITANMARTATFPLWFSFEVPARQFLSQFPQIPMIYMPAKLKPRALDWFEERVMEGMVKYGSRVIFVDHLHYLVDLAKQKKFDIEIGAIIRRLKTLAVSNNLVIFLLCHTTKGKHDAGLSYESIRDSSFISQESDCCIMVKRTPEKGEARARARVEFHRRTGVMERVIELKKVNGYLVEVAA